jgi:mono/diheme cytochrome c family protein
LAVLLTGCGGGANPTPLPTFTPIPTFRFDTPTPMPTRAATVAVTPTAAEAASVDPALVATGTTRYEALGCNVCHGPAGEGTDQGAALTNSTLSEDAFIDFMRSGGTVGPTHQYSTNKLSINGGRALYQYLVSLRK